MHSAYEDVKSLEKVLNSSGVMVGTCLMLGLKISQTISKGSLYFMNICLRGSLGKSWA